MEDGIFPFFLKNDVQAENTVVSAPDVHISVDIIRHPAAAADAGQSGRSPVSGESGRPASFPAEMQMTASSERSLRYWQKREVPS